MILLTGITGKSGRWFLKNLMHKNSTLRNKNYRVIVRKTSNVEQINQSGLNIEKAYGDLEDEHFLTTALKGVDTVFHVTGIGMSLKIVKAALKNKVSWIIMVHTTGIYSQYKSASQHYINTEKEITKITKGSKLSVTLLRPTMIYGSINDKNIAIFINMVDKLRLFPIVSRAQFPLQPVHEKDLGKAYYQVLINEQKTKGKNYILSGKSPIMLIDILKTISQYLGKKTHFISIPYPLAYLGSYILYIITFKKTDYRERVQRLVEPRGFSHQAANNDFDYSPMSFEKGVKPEVEEYLKLKNAEL